MPASDGVFSSCLTSCLVPNPKWNLMDGQLRQARAALNALHAEYGMKAWLNSGSRRPPMRGFKIAHGTLGKKIAIALKRC